MRLLLCGCCVVLAFGAPQCPAATTALETFNTEGMEWVACENLQVPDGAITLVPSSGAAVTLPKVHEPYVKGPDTEYYLGLNKTIACYADTDMLGEAVRRAAKQVAGRSDFSYSDVERVVPPIRTSGGGSGYPRCSGVRTFVGSRSSSIDATFTDHAEDCNANGWPPVQSYVMNLTAIANGEPSIPDFKKYINFTAMAEGLVGGNLPVVVFYFPIIPQNNSSSGGGDDEGSRYWTMVAAPIPDMQGGREQSVWFRFHQLQCAGKDKAPPCKLHGKPQYWYGVIVFHCSLFLACFIVPCSLLRLTCICVCTVCTACTVCAVCLCGVSGIATGTPTRPSPTDGSPPTRWHQRKGATPTC
jgi:hypothetical protein